jgi:hypothetical protein
MLIKIMYLFEDRSLPTPPDSFVTDSGLIPGAGEYVVLETGTWRVRKRYFDMRAEKVPVVQLLLYRKPKKVKKKASSDDLSVLATETAAP